MLAMCDAYSCAVLAGLVGAGCSVLSPRHQASTSCISCFVQDSCDRFQVGFADGSLTYKHWL